MTGQPSRVIGSRDGLFWGPDGSTEVADNPGIDHDEEVGFRPVVYIELPTGQVSWHMPEHPRAWDGHSTSLKYRRIRQFVDGQRG